MDRYEGFGEFVAARGAALSRTAYLLMGDHHAAADLLQAALEHTALHWRRVAAGGDPEAYVRRAMVNQRTSWWRRDRRVVAHGDVPERSVEDEFGRSDDRISFAAALRALAPRQRIVVVLRFYEDLTIAETAAVLGCSEGTVKSTTYDALARLRRVLPALVDQNGEVGG